MSHSQMKPKACVHNTCNNVMYVPDYKLHMMLMCESCTNEKIAAEEVTAKAEAKRRDTNKSGLTREEF